MATKAKTSAVSTAKESKPKDVKVVMEKQAKAEAQKQINQIMEEATDEEKVYLDLVNKTSEKITKAVKAGFEELFSNFIPRACISYAMNIYSTKIILPIIEDVIIKEYHKDVKIPKKPAKSK